MNESLARRFTGFSCAAAAAAFIIEVPLYFVYSGPRLLPKKSDGMKHTARPRLGAAIAPLPHVLAVVR